MLEEADPPPDPLRASLARAWAHDALDEHASIATFARFSLELLTLAAPPDLVARAHEAALDEIRHARGSFAVASWLSGSAVGPGALDIDGPLGASDPPAMVEATARDGCFGETAAAVIAAIEHDACAIPEIRELRAMIARDEARHASLAWRFVAWSHATLGARARVALVRAIDSLPAPGEPPELGGEHARYGRLDDATRSRIAARVYAAIEDGLDDFLSSPDAAIAVLVSGGWR